MDVGAGQIRGQDLAFGLLFGLGPLGIIALELLDLIVDRLQILIQCFFQQTALLGAEALRLGRELQALEDGVLVGELVDGGLFEGKRLEQRLHHVAQFLCAHVGQLFWVDHHETQCVIAHHKALLVHARIDDVAMFFE